MHACTRMLPTLTPFVVLSGCTAGTGLLLCMSPMPPVVQDHNLFELAFRVTHHHLGELSPHSLSDITWAFAATRSPHAPQVGGVAAWGCGGGGSNAGLVVC